MVDIPNELAKKGLEKLMDWAVGEARYICCFTSIAADCEKGKENLEAKVKAVGQRVDELKRSAQDTPADVTSCQDRAGELVQEDNKTKKTCFFGWCPNCIWRYNRGKELANKTKEIAGLIQEIQNLNITGLPPHLPGVEYHSSQNYISFKSRELIFKELLDALTDDNNYITGLHGMGGSGKTTLAIKVGQELKQSKQFDLVIDTTVSYTPDIRKIQDEIAVPLGLASELKDKTESERPKLLQSRLTNGEKILLILDDVWEDIKFEEIGIPGSDNHKGCRVLLTTRELKVCNSMECERIIQLDLLSDEDAWTLFQKHAGLSNSATPSLLDKGHEVARECRRLPLAISLIAKSLKRQEQRPEKWDAALISLRKSMPMHNVDENLIEIYKCLRYSYDNKKNEKVKRLFLLCSLFPEDEEIPAEILTRYSIGAGLFGEVYNKYHHARTDVAVAKYELIDSCLLLKAEEGRVKMHDLVREVAQLMADKEIRAVNLSNKHKKSVVEREKGMKYLSLEGNDKDVFSYRFDGSELEILKISCMVRGHSMAMPNSFFENVAKLRVLHLSSYQGRWTRPCLSLPQSIESLTNIRSLFLERLILGEISILGKLQSLETLDLVLCEVVELPREIAELERLRLLQMDRCEIGGNNAFEVIERCSSLEELYFINFKVDSSSIHKKITLPALQKYHIRERWLNDEAYDSMSKHVRVSDIDTYFSGATFKYLVQTAEALELEGFKGEWRNLIPEIVPIDHLVKLCLKSCPKLQFLINSRRITPELNASSKLVVLKLEKMENLKELCNGPLLSDFLKSLEYLFIHQCQGLGSILFKSKLNLSNLKTIKLFVCPNLVTLFQLSTSQSLVLLEELTIIDCKQLENIIADERIREKLGEEIVGADTDNNRRKSRCSTFPNLKTLYITDCPRLEFILPVLSARDVPALESVTIEHCDELKYIFGKYQHENEELDLHQEVKDVVLEMDLDSLPKFIDIFEECYHPECSSMKRSSSKPQMHSEPMKCKLRSSTSAQIPSFLKETEDQTIQKDSTSEKTVTATLSTDSETRSTSLGPLLAPPEKSIKRRVEEGTTSANAKTIASSTHSEPVSSLPGPLVTSEHKTYPLEDGDGQIAKPSFSGVTTEPSTTKDVDVRDSQETFEFMVSLTRPHAPVSLNEDASMKVSSIIEGHISKPDDDMGVSESKPSAIASKSPSVPFEGLMEISMLKMLANGISSFLHLSYSGNMNSEPVSKYYQKAEEMLKLLKPIIDVIVNSELTSDEVLSKIFKELGHAVDELKEHVENWHLLSSKVYFVMQVEPLISSIRTSVLSVFQQLKASQQCVGDELSSEHLEHCVQKLKHLGHEETSSVIKEAITEQLKGIGPSAEVLTKIADSLGLRTNQEVLIEAVALERLKENAEQTEKTAEAEYIDQMIAVVMHMHERLVILKQAQSSSPIPVPADFCCPLSLELMTDPVIVASGQTYERAFIKNWIDLGLTVCPKTRQTLAHTNLIPNYTLKALIANWCEATNVKLVGPTKSTNLNQASVHHGHMHERLVMPKQPSERLVRRIVSFPATETRTDLSAIETQVRNLVEGLRSSDLDTQREATVEIRFLAKHNMDNRIAIANCGAISLLVDLLRSADTRIQENAVTALLNLSINDNNKAAIANAGAIDPLIHVLETGSPEAKENSAATLFSLSVIEENKISIGRSGAIRPLVDLLGNGTSGGKKDAATALFNLSIFHENKNRIVQAGAVKHLVELMDPAAEMVDKAVAILANLATIPEGIDAIAHEGGIPVLVEVVEWGSARGKENAAVALLHLCLQRNRYLSMVLQQGAVPPLVALSQSGTPRAKEKAQALLNKFRSQRHGNAGRG